MANLSTTKMSSKGQVVIPEDIRKRLKLRAASQFVVVGDDDVVITGIRISRNKSAETTRIC